jgi:hypothetical protein
MILPFCKRSANARLLTTLEKANATASLLIARFRIVGIRSPAGR